MERNIKKTVILDRENENAQDQSRNKKKDENIIAYI